MRSLEDTPARLVRRAVREGWACRRSRELVAGAVWPPGACNPARGEAPGHLVSLPRKDLDLGLT